jgi:hypothetical protein
LSPLLGIRVWAPQGLPRAEESEGDGLAGEGRRPESGQKEPVAHRLLSRPWHVSPGEERKPRLGNLSRSLARSHL